MSTCDENNKPFSGVLVFLLIGIYLTLVAWTYVVSFSKTVPPADIPATGAFKAINSGFVAMVAFLWVIFENMFLLEFVRCSYGHERRWSFFMLQSVACIHVIWTLQWHTTEYAAYIRAVDARQARTPFPSGRLAATLEANFREQGTDVIRSIRHGSPWTRLALWIVFLQTAGGAAWCICYDDK